MLGNRLYFGACATSRLVFAQDFEQSSKRSVPMLKCVPCKVHAKRALQTTSVV